MDDGPWTHSLFRPLRPGVPIYRRRRASREPDDTAADRQTVREQVLGELIQLLEARLSPSQALDSWAVEDTEATCGAFTQAE